jgi:hypothetical protein
MTSFGAGGGVVCCVGSSYHHHRLFNRSTFGHHSMPYPVSVSPFYWTIVVSQLSFCQFARVLLGAGALFYCYFIIGLIQRHRYIGYHSGA